MKLERRAAELELRRATGDNHLTAEEIRWAPTVCAQHAMLTAMTHDASHAQRVSASRRIHACAADVFRLVADPAGHVRIDGWDAGGSPRRPPAHRGRPDLDMHMDRTPLNDVPGLVKYEVRNVVTRLEPDALIEWTLGPVGADRLATSTAGISRPSPPTRPS